jgi:DNA-directed RNA polymerase specialized sigma24 family protein
MHLRSPWQRSRLWLVRATGIDDAEPASAGWESMPGDAATSADSAAAIDLERALAQLSATARTVVWLHDVEGCTHAEIGALCGASASFSKSQLARAHARLRTLLHVDGVGTPCTPITSAV